MSGVLVVGGDGFVGRHLVAGLAAAGGEVHATYRAGKTPPATASVNWLPVDLAAAASTASWPERCDTLIYLAQSRRWRVFPDGADDVFRVNVAGVFHAAEYARRAGARRFVFASTGSVYASGPLPLSETVPFEVPSSRSFYAASKLASESLLAPYGSLFAAIVLRLFVPYGEGQAPDMLLPTIARKIHDDAPITLDGSDGPLLNPVAIADVVEAIMRCVRLERAVTLNVAGPESLRLRQIAERLGVQVGRTPRFERGGKPAPADLVGDTTLLRHTLGWAPPRTLADGLRDWLG
jgi:nucleoside-diphosphate-sugar epimerase